VAIDLFDQLRDSFRNGNPVAGAFLTAGGTVPPFQQTLARYLGADTDSPIHESVGTGQFRAGIGINLYSAGSSVISNFWMCARP
jgi:hypothetical protein